MSNRTGTHDDNAYQQANDISSVNSVGSIVPTVRTHEIAADAPTVTGDRPEIFVHNHDVLSGRSISIAQHPGNDRYKSLVASYIEKSYSKTASIAEKKAVAIQIMQDIQNLDPPGRFLKREVKGRVPKGLEEGTWEELTEKDVARKTCQALRDCLSVKERDAAAAALFVHALSASNLRSHSHAHSDLNREQVQVDAVHRSGTKRSRNEVGNDYYTNIYPQSVSASGPSTSTATGATNNPAARSSPRQSNASARSQSTTAASHTHPYYSSSGHPAQPSSQYSPYKYYPDQGADHQHPSHNHHYNPRVHSQSHSYGYHPPVQGSSYSTPSAGHYQHNQSQPPIPDPCYPIDSMYGYGSQKYNGYGNHPHNQVGTSNQNFQPVEEPWSLKNQRTEDTYASTGVSTAASSPSTNLDSSLSQPPVPDHCYPIDSMYGYGSQKHNGYGNHPHNHPVDTSNQNFQPVEEPWPLKNQRTEDTYASTGVSTAASSPSTNLDSSLSQPPVPDHCYPSDSMYGYGPQKYNGYGNHPVDTSNQHFQPVEEPGYLKKQRTEDTDPSTGVSTAASFPSTNLDSSLEFGTSASAHAPFGPAPKQEVCHVVLQSFADPLKGNHTVFDRYMATLRHPSG